MRRRRAMAAGKVVGYHTKSYLLWYVMILYGIMLVIQPKLYVKKENTQTYRWKKSQSTTTHNYQHLLRFEQRVGNGILWRFLPPVAYKYHGHIHYLLPKFHSIPMYSYALITNHHHMIGNWLLKLLHFWSWNPHCFSVCWAPNDKNRFRAATLRTQFSLARLWARGTQQNQ